MSNFHGHTNEDMEVASQYGATPTSETDEPSQQHNEAPSSSSITSYPNESAYSPGGPPTPTHSEPENTAGVVSSAMTLPTVAPCLSAVSNMSSLSQVMSNSPLTSLRPQLPSLTPSLSKLYREQLISHVTNWPAEAVEKACQRINDEHQTLSNLAITRVSAELKMARSLVRLAEIQATLQEQRILFLR